MSQSRPWMQPLHHGRAGRDRDWLHAFRPPSPVMCVQPRCQTFWHSARVAQYIITRQRWAGAGPRRTLRCLPTSAPVSSAIAVVVGVVVGVGVGINVQLSIVPPSMSIRGRPDREHRLRFPSPSVPRPSRPWSLYPLTPTPACLRCRGCQPQFSFQERTGAAGSGSGIEPMIPGAHACAQAFPPYFPSAAGC